MLLECDQLRDINIAIQLSSIVQYFMSSTDNFSFETVNISFLPFIHLVNIDCVFIHGADCGG